MGDTAGYSVNTKLLSARLCQNTNLRVLWLTIGWILAIMHQPSVSICFLIMGIIGTKFQFRSHQVSVVGTLLGLLIFSHPIIGIFLEHQPRLWSQDWLISSVGYGFLVLLFLVREPHIRFDSSAKYVALVLSGFAIMAVATVMRFETQLWVLGAGYDNSTHFRDMYDAVAQPMVSFPYPSNPSRTFSIITGLFLRILGVSSDTPTSKLLSWYLTSLFALTAAFIYASAKVIARNLQSRFLLLGGVVMLFIYICLTPISQTFVAGNPTQVFAIFLVFYYFCPALLSQRHISIDSMMIIGSLYFVNSSYPFTLVLLAPVVAARFFEMTIIARLASDKQKKSRLEGGFLGRKLYLFLTVSIFLVLVISWFKPNGSDFFANSWSQFVTRFSIVGGIEPYKLRVTYAITYFLAGLLLTNSVIYRYRHRIWSAPYRLRDNTYMAVMAIGGLLIALLVNNYSETIAEGGTYYAMKLSYSAAIIALVVLVAVIAGFTQGLIIGYQRRRASSNVVTTNRTFSLGVLAIFVFLSSTGYVLHSVSQQSPRVFQRAYMGSIPKFVSEFNDSGSSGINPKLVEYAAHESRRFNRPIFLVTGGVADRLGTIWVNEISGVWSYRLWEAINHVPPALAVGDINAAADHFDDLKMILITDDEALLIKLRAVVPNLVGCTLDEINIGMCAFENQSST